MLTDKQEAFVQALLVGKSQREAYRAAYNAGKALDRTVDNKASKLLAKAEVRARYDALRDKVVAVAEKKGVASAVQVLEELSHIALGDKEFPCYTMTGDLTSHKPSMSARLKALELLGRSYALFTDKVEQSGEVGMTEADRALLAKVAARLG